MIPDPIFLNIHMYGIMIAIGVLCAFATLFAVAKKKSIPDPTNPSLRRAGNGNVLHLSI